MRPAAIWLLIPGVLLPLLAGAAEDPFEIIELPSPGRTATAGFADLDGDGRTDVFAVALTGVPPNDHRELRVHFQGEDGRLPTSPSWSGEVIRGSGAYDVADLPDGPGQELLLLQANGVSVLSFPERELVRREIGFPAGQSTVAPAPDERGLDLLRLARNEFRDGPLLLVPGLGRLAVMHPDGSSLGVLPVGHRSNFFIPPRPGPLLSENEIESFYDFPRVDVGDVDGDGDQDIISSNRHEIRVFRRAPDGSFGTSPDPRLVIGRLTEEDHIRTGSGNVRVLAADFDGDGLTDLLVSHTTGGFLDAESHTTIHRNQGDGRWNLSQNDHDFHVEGKWTTWWVDDLDGQPGFELMEIQVPLSILEMVELLVTRAVDVDVLVWRAEEGGGFGADPWVRRSLSVGFRFDTFEPTGFVPSVEGDMNGDGVRDALASGDGEAVEVMLGGGKRPFSKRVARQKMNTAGYLRLGDLDGNGLTDFLLYDRTQPGLAIRIGVNRGVIRGTPTHKRLELRKSED